MMYLEYDWTSMVYRPRFGDTFIDVRGWHSFDCKREAVDVLDTCGLVLGKKTDSRTWEIVAKDIAELERPGGCGAARNPVVTERNHAAENAAAWYADIKAMMARLDTHEHNDVIDAIYDGPLSIRVRDDWRNVGERIDDGPREYEILLSTGGPALRVYGQIGQYGEPESAALQYQDWGTPWADWYPDDEGPFGANEVTGVLLAYARCFSFGE
jgi:hypothetical protein